VLAVTLLALAAPAGAARTVPLVGELKLLVILAGFTDRPLGRPRSHFVGEPNALVDRFVAYYAEVSAGRLHIVPTVGTETVVLPNPRASYVQRPAALAEDAVTAFASTATAAGDRAALHDANALVVFFAGSGRESHVGGGDPGDPWSNFAGITPPALGPDGFAEACVIAEEEAEPFSSFGVLCHEFGHLLGLPELYAPGGATHEGIGVWGLMGQGTWLGHGDHPPHLDAWSKQQLGWVDVETEPRVVRIPAGPDDAREYYLLENRARIGADERLPGEGILVWHVDERVQGFRSAQSRPERKLLHLVEADGRGDLDRGHAAGGNRGDADDPWRGPPTWRRRLGGLLALTGAILLAGAVLRAVRRRPLRATLVRTLFAAASLAGAVALQRSPVCGPGTAGMAPYEGGPTRVVLRNFSPAGPVMSVDVLVAPPSTPD
jgi:immune inhibitor A